MAGKAGRGSDQFMIRLPDGMRDRIKAVADKNGRSMNAEIVAALEEQYPARQVADEFMELMLQGLLLVESLPDGKEKDAARICIRDSRYRDAIEAVRRVRGMIGNDRSDDIEAFQFRLEQTEKKPHLRWVFK